MTRAGRVMLVTLILALVPAIALACPGCLSSAYGDRTYNWAFIGLLIVPFVVAAAVGGVFAYAYLRSRSRRAGLPGDYQAEETT